jgi:hypothetical protein
MPYSARTASGLAQLDSFQPEKLAAQTVLGLKLGGLH